MYVRRVSDSYEYTIYIFMDAGNDFSHFKLDYVRHINGVKD